MVQINGEVVEDYGFTQIEPSNVQILSQDHALPIPVELQPPFENAAARNYWETLEGMFVSVSLARMVGPTDSREETCVIRHNLQQPPNSSSPKYFTTPFRSLPVSG
jgi:hypothetical protein